MQREDPLLKKPLGKACAVLLPPTVEAGCPVWEAVFSDPNNLLVVSVTHVQFLDVDSMRTTINEH
jgi:hypothetical protein